MKLSNFFKFREGEDPEAVKPFLDHLEDLRWVIIKIAITLGVAMLVAFCFRTQLALILQLPLQALDPNLMKSGPCCRLYWSASDSFWEGSPLAISSFYPRPCASSFTTPWPCTGHRPGTSVNIFLS